MPTSPSQPHRPGHPDADRPEHRATPQASGAASAPSPDTDRTDTGAIVWADAEADPEVASQARSEGEPAVGAANPPGDAAYVPRPSNVSGPPVSDDDTGDVDAHGRDRPGWRIASIDGVPIYIGGGWVVIAIAMVFLFGPQIRSNLPELGSGAYVVALVYALLLLISVLVHEAAHAVAARLCGYRVHRVVADLMGGHTSYDASRATAGHSALVAVVGPLANAALAAGGYLALPLAGDSVSSLLIAAFAWTNAFVAIFNMLPGLPLDGGFLVDALVWKVTGKRHLGLLAAGWAGRIVTVLAVLYFVGMPLVRGDAPSLFTVVWTALIGAFLWMGASRAVQTGRIRRKLADRDLADLIMPVTSVSVDAPLADLPRLQLGSSIVVLMDDGLPVGVLDPAAVKVALRAGRADATLRSCLVAMPPAWRYDVEPGSHDLSPVVEAMVQRQVGALVLCDSAGTPHAILDGSRVDAAL